MAIKRSRPVGGGLSDLGASLGECEFSKSFPCLHAFLSDRCWDDGDPRETGTILLVLVEGKAKLWLNNKAEGLSAWISADNWWSVLCAADEGLGSGTIDWRRADASNGKWKGKK